MIILSTRRISSELHDIVVFRLLVLKEERSTSPQFLHTQYKKLHSDIDNKINECFF